MAQAALPLPTDAVSYVEDPGLATVAADLIRAHTVHFGHLENFRIAYLLVVGKKPDPGAKVEDQAKAVKAPAIWAALTGFDAVVWILDVLWRTLTEKQREALVAHQLSHIGMTEKGGVEMLPHDVSDFAFVARHWGRWNADLSLFGRQLRLFDEETSGAAAAVDQVFEGLDGKEIRVGGTVARITTHRSTGKRK